MPTRQIPLPKLHQKKQDFAKAIFLRSLACVSTHRYNRPICTNNVANMPTSNPLRRRATDLDKERCSLSWTLVSIVPTGFISFPFKLYALSNHSHHSIERCTILGVLFRRQGGSRTPPHRRSAFKTHINAALIEKPAKAGYTYGKKGAL